MNMTAVPVIETQRMHLVQPGAHHLAGYQAFIASDRARARGWDMMPHEAWRAFAALLGHGVLRGFSPFVMVAKEDGRSIGLVGPWHPGGQAEAEVKWNIWAAADEGKGFAYEGARAALSHVFGALGWSTAVSYIAHDNARSANLALRLGAVQDGVWSTPRGTEVRVFRHVGAMQ